MLLYRED